MRHCLNLGNPRFGGMIDRWDGEGLAPKMGNLFVTHTGHVHHLRHSGLDPESGNNE
jgi:hypothetical protein